MDQKLLQDAEFDQINQLYDECLNYLQSIKDFNQEPENTINSKKNGDVSKESSYDTVKSNCGDEVNICKDPANKSFNLERHASAQDVSTNKYIPVDTKAVSCEGLNSTFDYQKVANEATISSFKVENELQSDDSNNTKVKNSRLRRLSKQLPKIVVTKCNSSVEVNRKSIKLGGKFEVPRPVKRNQSSNNSRPQCHSRMRSGYGDFPKRLVSKSGMENVALISNVPFEKLRLLNDTFHTLINLRWRWIVSGTVVVHFAIWLVFAVFWYITALAHYDFAPDPPRRACVTGGKDFVTIFLASVEAQTTIGFGDRAIDEECPESIFLFIMQLILGTGLSGVLTCVVYAKLTRPEKLSRDGVGFSKKAVISMRDGNLCLMLRAWDLNYDHIISSEFNAHFIHTYKTKEGEMIRYYARALPLQTRQFLLWPVTLVHVIDETSPLYRYSPSQIASSNFEIALSLKGASLSMGTFTQSQTSYTPREIIWGHRFPPVVKYDSRKQKYVIDDKRLNVTEPVDTPYCSAYDLHRSSDDGNVDRASSPSSFSDQISGFVLGRASSFRKKEA